MRVARLAGMRGGVWVRGRRGAGGQEGNAVYSECGIKIKGLPVGAAPSYRMLTTAGLLDWTLQVGPGKHDDSAQTRQPPAPAANVQGTSYFLGRVPAACKRASERCNASSALTWSILLE